MIKRKKARTTPPKVVMENHIFHLMLAAALLPVDMKID